MGLIKRIETLLQSDCDCISIDDRDEIWIKPNKKGIRLSKLLRKKLKQLGK